MCAISISTICQISFQYAVEDTNSILLKFVDE